MDTLVNLSDKLALVIDPTPLIGWLKNDGLASCGPPALVEAKALVTNNSITAAGQLKAIVEMYKLARTGNQLAATTLLTWLQEGNLDKLKGPLTDELSILPCQGKVLGDWKITHLLGAGGHAQVWEVKNSKGEVAAAKRTTPIPDLYEEPDQLNEMAIAKQAGELGMGPLVYSDGKCVADSGLIYEYIIQQKLSGPVLDEVWPIPPEHVVDFLARYTEYVKTSRFVNDDISIYNMMYNGDKIMMIDYGIMAQAGDEKVNVSVRQAAIGLIKDLTVANPRWNISDPEARAAYFLTLATAIADWFYERFPKATKPFFTKKDRILRDKFGVIAFKPALERWLQ